MRHRHTIVRIAALASSLALVATYVSCRATHETTETAPAEGELMLPSSKRAEVFPAHDRTIMAGSKSSAPFSATDLQPQPAQRQSPRK